jgi:signal transduction histidine kinase
MQQPALRRTIAIAALAFAGITAVVGAQNGAPGRFIVLDTLFGLTFALAGFVAWERRPDVPYGPLLLTASFLWFVGTYAPTGWMPFSWLGFSFERYYDVILAVIVLTFPGITLRAGSRLALGLLAGGFAVRTASRLFVGCSCVENPIALIQSDDLFEALQAITSGLIAVSAVSIAGLALYRLIGSAPAARAVFWPVAIGGMVAALVAAWDASDLIVFIQTGHDIVQLPEPWDEVVAWSLTAAVAMVPIGYLVGVLRLRARRGPLASLAIQLDQRPGPTDLESALREALGDRSAQLFIWETDHERWLDAGRQPVPPPVETQEQLLTTLQREGSPVAAILHDRALLEDPGLIAATTALLRLALDNERLAAEVREKLEQVKSSRARLVETAEAERRRIERDLHDGAQQRLIAVALSLQEARAQAARTSPSAAFLSRLEDTADELMAAIDELRELARGIHPVVLTEDGLALAVSGLARRAIVPVELDLAIEGRLPATVESTAYFVVAEALTNIARHARATNAFIRMERHNDHLEIDISDDGIGGADISRGSGLRGLADRLDAISGILTIDRSPQGGTQVKARIPCE